MGTGGNQVPLVFGISSDQSHAMLSEVALDALTRILPVLEKQEDWSEAALHDAVMAAIQEFGMKNGQMLWPLRIAISGKANTPGGAFEIAYLLGKEETLKRLNHSIEELKA